MGRFEDEQRKVRAGGFSPRFFLGQNGLHFVDDIVNDLAAPFARGQDSALTYIPLIMISRNIRISYHLVIHILEMIST